MYEAKVSSKLRFLWLQNSDQLSRIQRVGIPIFSSPLSPAATLGLGITSRA
jgi:hypothetical protein